MKSVILAGGLGARISEETHLKPKPMVEIGGKPILWHVMKEVLQDHITLLSCAVKPTKVATTRLIYSVSYGEFGF
jgi:NDP-sugar pyrophosphorylase family protein